MTRLERGGSNWTVVPRAPLRSCHTAQRVNDILEKR